MWPHVGSSMRVLPAKNGVQDSRCLLRFNTESNKHKQVEEREPENGKPNLPIVSLTANDLKDTAQQTY